METFTSNTNLVTNAILGSCNTSTSYIYSTDSCNIQGYTYQEPISDYIKRTVKETTLNCVKEIIQALKDTEYITKDIPMKDIEELLNQRLV